MECYEFEDMVKKYELGEVNYFQRRAFEKHAEECVQCKEKYSSVLLLGAILYASKKRQTPSIFNFYVTFTMIKILTAIAGIAFILTVVLNQNSIKCEDSTMCSFKLSEYKNCITIKAGDKNIKTSEIYKINRELF